ncbi:MAG: fibronectin type III domain-containing protein [Opitutaceae bacterium]|nr:fibronectin type III domain-containing protein [Opitutaceae bacterium]
MAPALHFDTPGLRYDAGLRYDIGTGPGPDPYPPKPKRNKTMNKFKLELSRKTVPEKLALGGNHITSMTGNTTYPVATRVPTDAQFQTAQDNLATTDAAVVAAETAWKLAIAERDAAVVAWDTAITARANHCESVTPTDLVALASTGLPLRATPTPIGVLPMPANLQAKTSDFEGQLDLSCDAVVGASSYEWQCRLHTQGTTWENIKSSTTRKISVTGLTPGVQYAFRVRVLGTAGPSPWSDEAVKRVG